jgi:hypothetical protein
MPEEFLTPDDFGALSRALHAQQAAQEHYTYLVQRLWAKYTLGPDDALEPDGRITRHPSS